MAVLTQMTFSLRLLLIYWVDIVGFWVIIIVTSSNATSLDARDRVYFDRENVELLLKVLSIPTFLFKDDKFN